MDVTALPAYAELPRLDDIGANHSWGVFGPDDELGTLNLLDADAVRHATGLVRTGERVGLSLELDQPDPPLFRREPFRHTVTKLGGSMWDDRLDNFFPQGSTQWDGFRHHRVRRHGFYGGVTDDPSVGNRRLSIHHWASGIIGRGVLLDVAAHLGGAGYDPLAERSITADDLRATAQAQGVELRPGDVLCVRTGWLAAYRGLDPAARAAIAEKKAGLFSTGLAADEAIAELLWDWRIAAITADNPAVEVTPGDPAVGSLHRRVLGMLGIPLGELFDFDGLADRLSGRTEFLFVSVPLSLVGGLGSPGNAVAIL